MRTAEVIVDVVGAYLALGMVLGGLFVGVGVQRVDPGAHGAPWGFRALIFPGSVALWPLVLAWWIRRGRA